MRKVNLENIQEAGEYSRLTPGGYICRITNVEDIPLNQNTGKGDYLKLEFDIAEGDFKDYYKNMEENLHFWGGSYIRSYKEKALPMFKRMCSCMAKSNPGFVFDGGQQNSDEKTLIGKLIGLVLKEEEYVGNDGSTKTRIVVHTEKSIQEIKEGKFKIPEIKKLDGTSGTHTTSTDFMEVSDSMENIPF